MKHTKLPKNYQGIMNTFKNKYFMCFTACLILVPHTEDGCILGWHSVQTSHLDLNAAVSTVAFRTAGGLVQLLSFFTCTPDERTKPERTHRKLKSRMYAFFQNLPVFLFGILVFRVVRAIR